MNSSGKYLGDVEVDYYEREKKTGKSGRKQPSLKQFVDRKLGDDDKRSDEDEEPGKIHFPRIFFGFL